MAITPNTPNPVREDSYTTELATKLGIDPKYIPKSPVWRNEEEIAAIAEMFSNMAGGSSGGGVLVVNVDENDTFDKTWKEVHDAFSEGVTVIAVNPSGLQSLIIGDGTGKGNYYIAVAYQENWPGGMYTTSSADGYPVWVDA